MIYVNGSPINVTLFPDNTSQVWKVKQLEIPDTNWVNIKWEFSNESEFMHLAQLKTLLDNQGFDCSLRIKYLPYGRQDKKISNETTFALHSFSKLLNSLNFNEVIIHDPHNEAALMMIDNSRAVYPQAEIDKALTLTDTSWVCYPDKGAVSKYSELYKYPYLYGEKVRDQLTGNILSYKLIGNPQDKNILIVDDICDGGATFKVLADALYKGSAKQVNLFVTHGIFSKGLRTLKESGINKIFTQDGEISEVQNHITYRKI